MTYLILDLDGVLITTPAWKPDPIHEDGYSAFNHSCVENLNTLLHQVECEIWLSSSRRKMKTLAEFNQIFQNRGIIQEIQGFLPIYPECRSRREEIETFLREKNPS